MEKDDSGEYLFKFQYDLDLTQKGVEALFDFLKLPNENRIEEFFKVIHKRKQIIVELEENGDVTFTVNDVS